MSTKASIPKMWETRPLQCWDKAKELRRAYEGTRIDAAGQSKLLVDGMDACIFAALGNLQAVMTNPLGAMIAATNTRFSRESLAAAEQQGFGREICGYHREVFGSMYLNADVLGGPFPRRDISIPTPECCDQHCKRGQPVADYYGIPRFQGEAPCYSDPEDPERTHMMIEHRVAEVLEEIEWLEKVTGRKFDDEVYIDSLKSNMRLKQLAGEVYVLNRNIPAPLDQKSLYSFYTLGGLVRTEAEQTEAFWRDLRDEVQWRVDHKIAAVATERYRWIEDEPPPWHYLRYYRYMEKYGAVCIGSPYTFMLGGHFTWQPDGSYGAQKTPLELGMSFDTREDAVRAGVYAWLTPGKGARGVSVDVSARYLTEMAEAYHCDGAIMPLWRSGVGCVYGRREFDLALTDVGIKTMFYEGCQPGDKTDFDDGRMIDQLDHWMETQGLRKLED